MVFMLMVAPHVWKLVGFFGTVEVFAFEFLKCKLTGEISSFGGIMCLRFCKIDTITGRFNLNCFAAIFKRRFFILNQSECVYTYFFAGVAGITASIS